MHDRGISREGDLLDLALEDKIVKKSGNWHWYGEEYICLGNGREAVKQYLRDNPALVDEIGRKVLEKRGLTPPGSPASENGQAVEPAKPEQPTRKESRKQAAASK